MRTSELYYKLSPCTKGGHCYIRELLKLFFEHHIFPDINHNPRFEIRIVLILIHWNWDKFSTMILTLSDSFSRIDIDIFLLRFLINVFLMANLKTVSIGLISGITHYDDVIIGAMASEITSHTIVYSTVYSDADQREHQSSASQAFVWGNSPGTGEFPAQMASSAENVSIWWRHHDPPFCVVVCVRN